MRASEFDEDPSEQTTELPVVRLAWRRSITDSIPTPPQRPTLGANRPEKPTTNEPPADAPADEPLAAEDAFFNNSPFPARTPDPTPPPPAEPEPATPDATPAEPDQAVAPEPATTDADSTEHPVTPADDKRAPSSPALEEAATEPDQAATTASAESEEEAPPAEAEDTSDHEQEIEVPEPAAEAEIAPVEFDDATTELQRVVMPSEDKADEQSAAAERVQAAEEDQAEDQSADEALAPATGEVPEEAVSAEPEEADSAEADGASTASSQQTDAAEGAAPAEVAASAEGVPAEATSAAETASTAEPEPEPEPELGLERAADVEAADAAADVLAGAEEAAEPSVAVAEEDVEVQPVTEQPVPAAEAASTVEPEPEPEPEPQPELEQSADAEVAAADVQTGADEAAEPSVAVAEEDVEVQPTAEEAVPVAEAEATAEDANESPVEDEAAVAEVEVEPTSESEARDAEPTVEDGDQAEVVAEADGARVAEEAEQLAEDARLVEAAEAEGSPLEAEDAEGSILEAEDAEGSAVEAEDPEDAGSAAEASDEVQAAVAQDGDETEQVAPDAETAGEDVSVAAETAGQDVAATAETAGQDVAATAETAGQDVAPAAATAGPDVAPAAEIAGEVDATAPAARVAGDGVAVPDGQVAGVVPAAELAELAELRVVAEAAKATQVGRVRKKGKAAAKGVAVEPVAIVGLAARFPGAATLEQYWDNLLGGVESIRRFTPEEVQQAGGGEAFGEDQLVAVSGALDDVEAFDAAFFGLSAREAELTDPAQRMFLEVCEQALEHGGYAGPSGRIGVFAGSGMNLYTQQNQPSDSLATRVAYRLGLTGPAIGVQAAWSSSLVAVHLACQALRSGDADLALAGAAAVHVPQATGYHATPGSILSPSGHLRAFDAEADGTVGGNGVAAVLLKRLDQAVADGDTVYAVIKGSAVTNDGAALGQVDLIERALEKAGVPADSLSYIEANATGTAADDSVEFRALATALRKHTDKVGFCTIGSVKPNIGHLDSAAGMAGLIKTVLMLQHRTLVPTINYAKPNPELQLAGSPFVIGTEVRDWEAGTPLRAGVSALDAGGTNAHVILEEPPRQIRRGDDGPVVLPLSAPDPEALPELADLFRVDLEHGTGHRLIDLAGTAAIGRPAHRHRLAVAGSSESELAEALSTALAAEVPRGGPGPLGFAFTGQGAARRGMAAGLASRFPVFRAVLDECDKVYEEEFGGSLLELLLTPAGTAEGVWPTETAQPALFAFELALARLWQSFGVQPALVVGHSVGEYAALVCGRGAVVGGWRSVDRAARSTDAARDRTGRDGRSTGRRGSGP